MKTFIINVSSNEFRRNHMLSVVSAHKCIRDYHFIHEGDVDNISQEIQVKYFGGELSELRPVVSCAYKHILAYYEISKLHSDECALILEDDIFLYDNFCFLLREILEEIAHKKMKNFLISLEESNLKYVRKSERKEDSLLYKKPIGRMAGAYLMDTICAQALINEIENNKCNLAIDWFHNYCAAKGLFDIYWAHPPIAIQGSLNGKIKSLIDDKPIGRIKIMKFNISKIYKRILYGIR